MHDINVEPVSQILQNKKITLVCGGGIAAIEMPRVARALRRHGADVQFFVTKSCLDFIGLTSLQWSSQNPVIQESSGLSEHICTSDAVIVAPATANLISSARHGLCQNSATTLIQSSFGQNKPVIFVPTMHESMLQSPIIHENINILKRLNNVVFIEPRHEEGKAKILPPDILALTCAHYINRHKLSSTENILISLGSTRVMIDPVRCLSNLSTGKLGWKTAKLFYGMGYTVSVVAGQTDFELQNYQNMILHKQSDYFEIYEYFKSLKTDSIKGFFHFLAGIDYAPESTNEKKLDSMTEKIHMTLKSVPKIRMLETIEEIPYKFFCKLTSHDDLKTKSRVMKFFRSSKIQSLLWNTVHEAWHSQFSHSGTLISYENKKLITQKIAGRTEIANAIYKTYVSYTTS